MALSSEIGYLVGISFGMVCAQKTLHRVACRCKALQAVAFRCVALHSITVYLPSDGCGQESQRNEVDPDNTGEVSPDKPLHIARG